MTQKPPISFDFFKDIYFTVIQKLGDYQIFVGSDGKFYYSDSLEDNGIVPENHVVCLIRKIFENQFPEIPNSDVKKMTKSVIKVLLKKAAEWGMQHTT
jgi:hypothetical protein